MSQAKLRIVIGCALFFVSHYASAQGKVPKPDATLETKVDKLQQGQEQLLKEIADLRKLISGSMAPMAGAPAPPSKLTMHDERFRGDDAAKLAVVEYADFECPYCGQYAHDIYPEISKDYIQTGKVKYFYRDMPLPMHPHAMIAARAARCAGEQGKFWEMHDSLFANQRAIRDVDMPDRAKELGLDGAKFAECLAGERYTDQIKQSVAEAQKLGIEGTPTFFIGTAGLNGEVTNLKMIIGARPYDDFKSVIEESLAAKK